MIKLYDCPSFTTSQRRGKLFAEQKYEDALLLCDTVCFNNEYYAVFKKVYNYDERCIEIWVKGEVFMLNINTNSL